MGTGMQFLHYHQVNFSSKPSYDLTEFFESHAFLQYPFSGYVIHGILNQKRESGIALTETDDLYRAKTSCFLCTTTERVRYNPLCPISTDTVVFDNFRK
jgi:hypothetical protein